MVNSSSNQNKKKKFLSPWPPTITGNSAHLFSFMDNGDNTISVNEDLSDWNFMAQSFHSQLSDQEERILFPYFITQRHFRFCQLCNYAILGFRLSGMKYGMKKTNRINKIKFTRMRTKNLPLYWLFFDFPSKFACNYLLFSVVQVVALYSLPSCCNHWGKLDKV